MSDTKVEGEWVSCELVYKGLCVLAGGGIGHEYMNVTTNEGKYFSKCLNSGRSHDVIGGLYRTKTNGQKTLRHDGWVGTYHDHEAVKQWQAATIVLRAECDRQRAETKARVKEHTPLYQGLLPIREAYQQAPANGRAALLAEFITFIMRG